MAVNLISTDNRYIASDYTITNLVDGKNIFLNTLMDVNIVNKSMAMKFLAGKNQDDRLYGLRIVDDVAEWFKHFSANDKFSFFVVSSYEAYRLLTGELKSEKPVLYLEDAVMEPAIADDLTKSERIYTFANPLNLDERLLEMYEMDIYSANSYINPLNLDKQLLKRQELDIYSAASPFVQGEAVSCNLRGRMKGRFIEWTPDCVAQYAKYNTAYIYYSKKHSEKLNALKSINRMSQCFYFNQDVVTNYPGRFHPDIEKALNIERIDDEFYKICGNTRNIYDRFLSREVIKDNLIRFCNKLTR